ncbi:hypothetical protein Tco_1379914 [Tanacetum coccineum]
MSGALPPIPPPLGTNSSNAGSPNRVDTMPTTNDTTNTTSTTNVAQNVVDENLHQLLDSRGGSHVINVPAFDKEDFTSWKVRFLVFLDGLEPYLLKTLEYGPFVPLSNMSTSTNPLPKPHNQSSNAEAPMWNDLILAHEGPSDTRDTKIAAPRLKFNAFKVLEGEKVNETFTSLKCLLNDLENNGVIIPQAKVNTALYGKYNYEEDPIDQIYESEIQRFTIHASSSKALISNNQFQDNDSDVEEDLRSSSEFITDLNVEYHERALLANQKRFYKRSGRVGSVKKPVDKSNEICFACGKQGHFQKECPSNKTSTPSYPSTIKPYNKPKFHSNSTSQHNHNIDKNPKDYKVKYKGLKAKIDVLTKRINAMSTEKIEKGLVAESFDWDEEYVSLEDEGTTKVKAFIAIAKEEPFVGKADARSG